MKAPAEGWQRARRDRWWRREGDKISNRGNQTGASRWLVRNAVRGDGTRRGRGVSEAEVSEGERSRESEREQRGAKPRVSEREQRASEAERERAKSKRVSEAERERAKSKRASERTSRRASESKEEEGEEGGYQRTRREKDA